jgi:hypothetical protein
MIFLFLVITGVAMYVSWRTSKPPCVWKTIAEPTCTPEPGQITVLEEDGWHWIDGPTRPMQKDMYAPR